MTVAEKRKETPKRVRFAKEKEGPYRVPRGTYESVQVIIREAFPEDTLGVSDNSFWSGIEQRALLTPQEACFQYYLAGIGHYTLAELLIDGFQTVRTAVRLGDITPEERLAYVERLSGVLYDYYPDRYKESVKE